MADKIVAGNWKMHKNKEEAIDLTIDIVDEVQDDVKDISILLLPPFVHLTNVSEILDKLTVNWENQEMLQLGGQNCHYEAEGAFTGEISPPMLSSIGADYVIIGHSERRNYFNEDHKLLAKKVDTALQHSLTPIFCCGESLEERTKEKHFATVEQQLKDSLFHLDEAAFNNLIIAYEPVWAIGTGETATPSQAQAMHKHIRELVENKYSQDTAEGLSILYGGSCKPENAAELFAQGDINGGLIGGASLKADSFAEICRILQKS